MNNTDQMAAHLKEFEALFARPLQVDSSKMSHLVNVFHSQSEKFHEKITYFNKIANEFILAINTFTHIYSKLENLKILDEMSFICKRLDSIEKTLKNIHTEGLKKNIDLKFSVDGYTLVKKQKNYDPTEEIEDKHKSFERLRDFLDEREFDILKLRVGFLGKKPLTFTAIGALFKIGGSRVSQIYGRAIRKCRHKTKVAIIKEINDFNLSSAIFGPPD